MTTARRRHNIPFGAELRADGRVRFRLWAPAARQVELCLWDLGTGAGPPRSILPMTAEPEGWFALSTDRAAPGTRYRFRIDGAMQVPDPASRFQPQDVHGASAVVDPAAWRWRTAPRCCSRASSS